MTSHYRNTISIACFLICLFTTTSATAHSFIRQFTDDHNTELQQEVGAQANQNLDVGHHSHKNKEISSRDYKVSASNTVTGLTPSSYSIKMESFNTLLKSTYAQKYESRPFSVGGYNWTLVVFPNGNAKDSGQGYLSFYIAIDNSTFVGAHQEIYADVRFYIFNKKQMKYFTFQDNKVWTFDVSKTMWGFPRALSVVIFKDPRNGYLYDGDHCEFGVDVTIPNFCTPSLYKSSELFSVAENFPDPKFTWAIRGFSTLLKDKYLSDAFSIGGRSWNIQIYPNGCKTGKGKALSMFLALNENEKFRPYEKIYVRAKLRVLNQRNLNNVEMQIDNWYNGPGYGKEYSWGFYEIISLSSLRASWMGYVVNDRLMVQVEIEAISSTKYLPS